MGCKELDVSSLASFRWDERGGRNVSLHNILKLAAALDVDPGVLVKGLKPPAS